MKSGDTVVGLCADNSLHGLSIFTYTGSYTFNPCDSDYDRAMDILYKAFKRDDVEIAGKFKASLPEETLTRAEVLGKE